MAMAEQHPKVLAVPAPVVHFADFWDSALMFRLYYHTTLDFGMISETEIRFQIDERFRELGIVIPFPQKRCALPRCRVDRNFNCSKAEFKFRQAISKNQ